MIWCLSWYRPISSHLPPVCVMQEHMSLLHVINSPPSSWIPPHTELTCSSCQSAVTEPPTTHTHPPTRTRARTRTPSDDRAIGAITITTTSLWCSNTGGPVFQWCTVFRVDVRGNDPCVLSDSGQWTRYVPVLAREDFFFFNQTQFVKMLIYCFLPRAQPGECHIATPGANSNE